MLNYKTSFVLDDFAYLQANTGLSAFKAGWSKLNVHSLAILNTFANKTKQKNHFQFMLESPGCTSLVGQGTSYTADFKDSTGIFTSLREKRCCEPGNAAAQHLWSSALALAPLVVCVSGCEAGRASWPCLHSVFHRTLGAVSCLGLLGLEH